MERKSVGSAPQSLKKYFEVRDKNRGRRKSSKSAVSLDEKLRRHRKKFK